MKKVFGRLVGMMMTIMLVACSTPISTEEIQEPKSYSQRINRTESVSTQPVEIAKEKTEVVEGKVEVPKETTTEVNVLKSTPIVEEKVVIKEPKTLEEKIEQ